MEMLSVIIPVYNEEKTVEEIVERVNAVQLPIKKEVIVVNDASTDHTKEILERLKNKVKKVIHHSKNKGKGSAVRTGLQNASGSIIIIQDADLEYFPSDFPKLIKPILNGHTKVVFGSRIGALWEDTTDMYWLHYFGNRFLSFMTSLLYGTRISDMETCYKVFRKEVLQGVRLRARRFDLEPEITAKILKRRYKIKEVPIRFQARKFHEGKKITWKDGVLALYLLLKYRFVD